MTKVTAAHSMSLDGFIDSPRLHDWLTTGDTPSRVNPAFTMSAPVAQAATAAAGGDVVLMGASIVQQCLAAGLLDELIVSLVPMVLGHGVCLLDNLAPANASFSLAGVTDAPGVTQLTYHIVK